MNVLIIGARGNIGRHVASCLIDNPEIKLYLASHSDEGRDDLAVAFNEAEAVKVDVNDAGFVSDAVIDMHRVVVISPDFTDERTATGNLIAALKGVDSLQQIIRVLGLFPGLTENRIPTWMREVNATCWQHMTAKRLLEDSGLPVTFVNPVARYMQNYRGFTGTGIRDRHVIAYPFPQVMPHIDTRDIAEVIACILQMNVNDHAGREYILTGAKEDVLSCAAVAELFSSVLGFKVEYRDDRGYFHEMLDPELATLFVDYLRWQQQTIGDLYDVTDGVRGFLDREPRKFRDWIRENADFFRASSNQSAA
ncbi:MAG: NmrA family NAD(P)-binding protein [Gammaproteobacteria bacterium]|nr:NmrA family NAD(P)-binding protein [Gammaproteobacteria bacterium]